MLTVFRTHPLIHVSYLLALIPGVVLLANGAASITILVVYGGIVAFAHSNTRLSFGPLGRVFVSPNFHRIHHQLDGPQDVNLGFALTIWDQIFHRAVFPNETTVRIDTGLPGRPLIVEQADVHPGILQCSPLNWWRHSVLSRDFTLPPSIQSSPQAEAKRVTPACEHPGHVSVTSAEVGSW